MCTEIEGDNQLAEDMDAIAEMLRVSEEEGLQVEVVIQFAYEVKSNPIKIACAHALMEWIK